MCLSRAVVTEIIRSLLTPDFLRDMFRPQTAHPFRTLRAIFTRLAHSSIMRINDNSMSKLYDLMVMAFKYQCLVCGHPSRVNGEITSLHVSNLKAILSSRGSAQANAAHTTLDKTTVAVSDGVAGDGSSIETEAGRERAVEASLSAACSESGGGTVENLIEAVARTILAVYNDLPLGELWSLYSNLLSFFQDRRVKVSALLVSNLQGEHGDMVLHPPLLGPSPRGQPSPGYYRRFDASGKVLAVHGVGSSGFPALASLHGTTSTPTTIPQRGAPLPNREDWRTLGRNIYCDKADDSMNFPSSLSPGPAQGPVSPKKEGAGRDAAAPGTGQGAAVRPAPLVVPGRATRGGPSGRGRLRGMRQALTTAAA